jgi:hypothetical protein
MTAELQKRYSNGLQFIAAYTYGHALANSGTTLSGSPGLYTITQANYNSSYTNASWDIRHNFTLGFNYDIPFGKGRQYGANLNPVLQTILGNWQSNGILTFHTGQPFTLRANCSQVVGSGGCGPQLISGSPNDAPPGGRNPNRWFNTADFTAPLPLTLGNVGLQSNYGPPVRTVDFSIFKDFPFTERFKMEFRGEAFNIANTPQFGFPDNNFQDANFGKITSTNTGSERHIQFSLRLQF